MSITNLDVVIVGGGVIAGSIAYHVAKQGRRVLVVERSEEVASTPAASWASAGGVRRQGRHPAEAQLAIEAIERWRTLEQELDADLHYRRGGNLLLAESDVEAEQLNTFVQKQQEMGFTDVRLVDRQEVRSLVAGLNHRVVAGSYSPGDGQANPVLTTRAFAAAAKRYGATYWNGTATRALMTQGERVQGVQTERGEASDQPGWAKPGANERRCLAGQEVRAEHIVLAAGAWSDEIAATVGLRLPIRTRALQMLLSTPAPSKMLQPVLSAVSRALSLKQLNDGAFLIGGGWLGDPTPDRRSYTMRQSSVEGNWATACKLLPAAGHQQIARTWCG